MMMMKGIGDEKKVQLSTLRIY